MTVSGRVTGALVTVLVFAVVVLPFVLIGSGAWLLWQREDGTRVRATVDSCQVGHTGRSYSEDCTGTWRVDGHVVTGAVDGATSSQEGDTIDATVRGDTAYSRSLTLPIILIGLGAPFLVLPVRWLRTTLRRRSAHRPGRPPPTVA